MCVHAGVNQERTAHIQPRLWFHTGPERRQVRLCAAQGGGSVPDTSQECRDAVGGMN